MSILYAFFFILVASINSAIVQGQGDTSKVAVTLYYETLCPFSQEFITDELAPTFLDSHYGRLFKEIHLVPFGIAEMINTTAHEYACQHDEAECQGNRFHACAIKHIEDKKSLVKYISCLAETVEVDTEEEEDYPVDKCLDKVPDGLYPKILECYNSEEGWNLLAEHGTRTKKFFSGSGEEFVPYVSFNNKKDDDLAEEAIKDLEKVMCQLTGLEHSGSLEESEDEDEEF